MSTTAAVAQTGTNVHLLPQTNQLRARHTVIRDRDAPRADVVLHSGRIIRLLVESALNLLPYESHEVPTPIGATYAGARPSVPFCGVSVMRAGDSMAGVLREVEPDVRIGKILIQRDRLTKLPHRSFVALPRDIADQHVLLLDPMLATGGTALSAVDTLIEHGVAEENIVFVNLITVSTGIAALHGRFPMVKLVTSAIDERLNDDAYMIPGIGDFGDRFFGTDL